MTASLQEVDNSMIYISNLAFSFLTFCTVCYFEHLSLRVKLILLFTCSYISFTVAEQKNHPLNVTLTSEIIAQLSLDIAGGN